VTFMDGNKPLGKHTLSASGATALAIPTLAVGSHSVRALYGGDAGDVKSVSSALTVKVTAN